MLLFILITRAISVSEGKHTLKLLDSSVVDIYKDAHAVVFMINPHSASSLGYVRSVVCKFQQLVTGSLTIARSFPLVSIFA